MQRVNYEEENLFIWQSYGFKTGQHCAFIFIYLYVSKLQAVNRYEANVLGEDAGAGGFWISLITI